MAGLSFLPSNIYEIVISDCVVFNTIVLYYLNSILTLFYVALRPFRCKVVLVPKSPAP